MNWEWAFAAEIAPRLLSGLIVTVKLTLLGATVAFSLGLVLALAARSRGPAKWVTRLLVEFIRSTPILVQIYFVFYVFPAYGITLGAVTTVVAVLGVHFATYLSEVYRAGIEGVSKGQWEAAAALNLPRRLVWTRIVLPQAIPRVLPALGNYANAMFKETPLAATVAVPELLFQARIIGSQTFRYLEPMAMVGLMFLAVSLVATAGVRLLERRVKIG